MGFKDDTTQPASQRKRHALNLFAGLADDYDTAGAVLSLGCDPRWRKTLVAALRAGSCDRVLDAATGTALVAQALVESHGCAVVAIDQSSEMLASARRRVARDHRLSERIEIRQAQAEDLPFDDASFDAVCFTYLLRYVDDPAAVLAEIARVVKPGGQIASLEFAIPESTPIRALWSAYTSIGLPAVGRLFSRDWYEVGRFLGPSIRDFYERFSHEQITELRRSAGIQRIWLRRMTFGAAVLMWGVKADGQAQRS